MPFGSSEVDRKGKRVVKRYQAEDYSPDEVMEEEFIIPASDAKGHSSREWFRIQPGHARQLDIVLRSRKFPYRTKGDIMRHGLCKVLKWLDTIADMPSVMKEVDVIMEILRDDEFNRDLEDVLQKLGERISAHLGAGSTNEAKRVLGMVIDRISKMPEGHWRDKYLSEVKQRYGHILDQGKRANLGPAKAKKGGK